MRLHEFALDQFGVLTPNAHQVAEKHGVRTEVIMRELERGTAVEKKRTKDYNVAREIALNHLAERPDYYERLEEAKKELQTFTCRWCKKEFESELGKFCPHCSRFQDAPKVVTGSKNNESI